MTQQPPPVQYDIIIDPGVEPGVHADFVSLWHTSDVFVLDFAALRKQPEVQEDSETERQVLVVPTRIVSRVKVPPAQIFELMKHLERQLSAWEIETGQRRPDQPPPEHAGH